MEEGQYMEAEAVSGVENAPDADQGEVRTRQFPEDDVPEEYQTRSREIAKIAGTAKSARIEKPTPLKHRGLRPPNRCSQKQPVLEVGS